MKIVSRMNPEERQIERLQEIIEAATGGAIGPDGEYELADDLHGLVTQVDTACASLMEANAKLERRINRLLNEKHHLNLKLAEANDFLQPIRNGVSYDEHLDEATAELMQAFLASGAASDTFDGEITFDSEVVFSRADLKPILKHAIEAWLNSKTL